MRPADTGAVPAAQPVQMSPIATTLAIVFVAASAMAVGTAWPFTFGFESGEPLWWLQILALATLADALRRSTHWRSAAVLGWVFATTWQCATFWWLHISMHTYAGLNALLAAIAILTLAMALGVYYAVACVAYWKLKDRQPIWASASFAAAWTMAEMARGTWFTGFGWGAVGYAHVTGPLAAYIPWLGAYGVGALAAWLSAALALSIRGSNAWLPVGMSLVIGAGLAAPLLLPVWSAPAGTLSVTLLQGNIPQEEKFQTGSGVPLALQWYGDQINRSTTELVVAPETAIPLLPQDLPVDYWDALAGRFARGEQAALVGIPLGNMTQGYTNSVMGFSPGQQSEWRYDKHHLVPFGEFIPPFFRWFTRMMNIPLGDFNRGAVGQPSFAWKGQRLAPNICYEDLFGEELGARFVDPEQAPTIFVNVSNIGWFGDSVAIDQHLQISRMRALEFERPMIRATNTGATAIIDHTGQVTETLPRHTRGVLVGTVQGRTGNTPFARWVARFGLWPLWILAVAIIFVATRAQRTRAS